ncbi:hypothetical protein A2154_04170 [Candidatus Gottesmanbacteria bacterium RBG_16_43_7]|uniref:Triosephosphate isomerase n=1 Tax=Candidatus Gottesmanbacteria bacterium RBG_16_43_7 TaxID=1798373 RepID=A0A1F5Z993_9BACT|nr:MAG: hypothetical protein A2154_04170 [Candidatus Gottesmanbacteria bacterium RBG_16_43_7]
MKQIIIVANWKSHKTVSESVSWLDDFYSLYQKSPYPSSNITVILAVPYTDLYPLREKLRQNSMPLVIAAQDLSPFSEGAYTGQITARMIKETADWVIIGHSERRQYFHETDTGLYEKVMEARKTGLKIIYCVSGSLMPVPAVADVVAYEPVWAIGTGKTDTPANARQVVAEIKNKSGARSVIYGGSVNPTNVSDFINVDIIDGVLVGGASLDPVSYHTLIGNSAGI